MGGGREREGGTERERDLGKLNKSFQSMKNRAEFLPNLADKLEQLLPSDILTSARYRSIWTNHCGGFPEDWWMSKYTGKQWNIPTFQTGMSILIIKSAKVYTGSADRLCGPCCGYCVQEIHVQYYWTLNTGYSTRR